MKYQPKMYYQRLKIGFELKLLAVLGFFILDFYLTSKVISQIGFTWIMLWFFVSFIVGMLALKNTPMILASNLSALFSNQNGIKNIYSGSIFFIAGAILLIIPGVLNDLVGVLMISYSLYLQKFGTITNIKTKQEKDSDVIDAEIISSHAISNNSNCKHSM